MSKLNFNNVKKFYDEIIFKKKKNYYFYSQGNCVAWKHLKLVNVPCDNSLATFHDVTTDGDAKNSTKTFLGYLCETRQIQTINGADMCYFPFVYQGNTYTSCSFENNTLLNNNGAPWCATEVSISSTNTCSACKFY